MIWFYRTENKTNLKTILDRSIWVSCNNADNIFYKLDKIKEKKITKQYLTDPFGSLAITPTIFSTSSTKLKKKKNINKQYLLYDLLYKIILFQNYFYRYFSFLTRDLYHNF